MQSKTYDVRNGRNRYHLIPYVGNKSGFAHIFDELVPDDAGSGEIVDVFGGSGAFAIYCCFRFGPRRVTYNDNNPVVVNLMKCVRDDPAGLAGLYGEHRSSHSGDYYLGVRRDDIATGLEGAARFLYLAKNAFSGKIRFNAEGRFNSPMRKGSKCPRLDEDGLMAIARAIRPMNITNRPFGHWRRARDAFLYLDPPYMNNTNGHYNMVPSTGDFAEFVRAVTPYNRVMISEQSDPADIGLPDCYAVHRVRLRRSLQYATRNDSREVVAINYDPAGGSASSIVE